MNNIPVNKIDRKVRQSNNFVESPYAQEFTATELKILEIAVADCKVVDKILVEKENNKKFEFTTKELAKLLNTSVSSLSHEAERLSQSIIKKYIHGRRELVNGEIEFETIAIIPYTKYESGIFSFELNYKLLPYFIEINEGFFTEYSLRYLMNLKSAYAIKLYKLLFQYRNLKKRKFAVNELKNQLTNNNSPKLIPFTLDDRPGEGAWVADNQIHIQINQNKFTMTINELALQGKHNQYNTMAAGISGKLLGLNNENMRESFSDFTSLEHRLEFVAQVHGIEFINDSKATNVNSSWYALESQTKPVIWIVGGIDKGNDYALMTDLVKKKVKAIVCLGKDNTRIQQAFSKLVDIIVNTESMRDCVEMAYRLGNNGDVVLLSPACASFDLFENYEDRGRQFKRNVLNL